MPLDRTRLGPYEIVCAIAAGGMGEVYRAKDLRLEREVALKVLPEELAEDLDRLARFEREAKALAALNHPHIVVIYSVEEADGIRFLTMECLEGQTLDRLIHPGGMELARFLSIAVPLADALAAAHTRGVLHRDLKPENVMVTEEGRVKILDFGLAKLATEPEGGLTQAPTGTLERMTLEGQIVGTVPYMSPEQVQGRAVDARSDLFSLGAVLYEMATGRRPVAGESAAEVVSSILRDDPPPLTDLRPELPRQLGRILRRCLTKDRERRFQSAKDLRNELEELREELHEERLLKARTGEGGGTGLPTASARESIAETAASSLTKRFRLAAVGAAVLAVLLATGTFLWLQPVDSPPSSHAETSAGKPSHGRTALAVLPFRNLSADPEDAYFAGGLHEEILTQLSRVAALSLRGRTSVMGYADTTKPIRQIAEELQVGAIVEGSVQVVEDRLRVNVQLLDAATDEHLWAESYDRTLEDAFAIQSDVAQRVVAVVGAALTRGEQRAIAELPTASTEAYRLYLQGRDYLRRPGYQQQNLEIAQQLFEGALELDPAFALAHAELSNVHGAMHWWRYDPSPERLEAQRATAEAALRLAPELPEAHLAMGLWHYRGRRDWAAALAQYEIARRGLPNDSRLMVMLGAVHRRLGNWDEALAAFERAVELDPRDAGTLDDLGGYTYRLLGRYAEAERAYDRALSLSPDFHLAAVNRGWARLEWKGELDTLRAALDRIPRGAELGWLGSAAAQRAELLLFERDAVRLLEHLRSIPLEVLQAQWYYLPKELYASWGYQVRGEPVAARVALEAALESLESVPPQLEDDWRVHSARGLAVAGLGRREEALREARWLEQSVIYRDDANWHHMLAHHRALILAHAAEAAAALDEIERLLAGPSLVTVHTLRLDPRWDPIRDHPRFQALLTAYAEG